MSGSGFTECLPITFSIISGYPKPYFLLQNNPTAFSFAAFSTAGMVPPARNASKASPRHGNASRSGASKVRLPILTMSSFEKLFCFRSGYVRANCIGSLISGEPSWQLSNRLCIQPLNEWYSADAPKPQYHPVVFQKPVSLNNLQTFIHHGCRINCYFAAHAPVRMI